MDQEKISDNTSDILGMASLAAEASSKQEVRPKPTTERIKQFSHYAPPDAWGTWKTIESHGGPQSFTISYRTIGEATKVFGKVRYFSTIGEKKELEFIDECNIHCGNAIDNIEACFKGVPFGSAVEGTVSS